MINMASMPLHMWEMWDATPVTDGRTDSRKVVQYSVWTESAIEIYSGCYNNNNNSVEVRSANIHWIVFKESQSVSGGDQVVYKVAQRMPPGSAKASTW